MLAAGRARMTEVPQTRVLAFPEYLHLVIDLALPPAKAGNADRGILVRLCLLCALPL